MPQIQELSDKCFKILCQPEDDDNGKESKADARNQEANNRNEEGLRSAHHITHQGKRQLTPGESTETFQTEIRT